MIALAATVLGASLLGSPHCAGMCGGFVCFYTGQEGRTSAWTHAAYNLGRLASYLALGVLAGLAGHALDRFGVAAGVQRGAAIVAGTAMVTWGAVTLATALGARLPHRLAPAFARRGLAAAMRAVHAQTPAMRALVVGLVTTLLPCGWLWVYVAAAAGTGSVAGALLVMSAFWLGTLPMMAGLGLAAQRAMGPLRRRMPLVTACLLMAVGLLTIGGRFQMAGAHGERCAPQVSHGGR